MKRASSLLLIVPLLASAAATGCQRIQADASKSASAEGYIAYELPVTRTITDYAQFPGTTDAIISVQVTSRVSGYMTEVHFKDGDMVKEGDLLFTIDPRQYKADVDRTEGNMQQIEAHQSRVEKEYHRAKVLLARGQISRRRARSI